MRILTFAFVCLSLMILTGCRQSSQEVVQETSKPADSANQNEEPNVTELKITDLTVGDGATAEPGKRVTVHFRGTLTDGTEFDASRNHGSPFTFSLGGGEVISGWDEGVKGMKVGGKRKLVIPPHMGYGERGAGNVIPPNATLVFEVELLDVQ